MESMQTMNDVFIAVLWDEMQPGADLDSTIFLSRLVEEADTASLQSGPPNGCLQLRWKRSERALIQPERLDCRFVNRSGDKQPLVALIIRKRRSRLNVQ